MVGQKCGSYLGFVFLFCMWILPAKSEDVAFLAVDGLVIGARLSLELFSHEL